MVHRKQNKTEHMGGLYITYIPNDKSGGYTYYFN